MVRERRSEDRTGKEEKIDLKRKRRRRGEREEEEKRRKGREGRV